MKDMRLSDYHANEKKIEKERYGAGRPFQTRYKRQISNAFVYYRLYITYTLTGFLFDLDQSNICRDIQKIERIN